LKNLRGDIVHLEQGCIASCFRIVGTLPFRHCNSITFRQQFERLRKRQALDLLHEGKNIACRIAAETLVILQCAMYAEGRRFLGVKRAQSHVPGSGALLLQPHVVADHIHNVELILKLFREIHVT
jgi:hypothetical protein